MKTPLLKNLLFLFLIYLLTSCSPSKRDTIDSTLINFRMEQLNKIPFTDYIKSYTIIPLETNEQSLISRIEKVQYKNKKFFILNKDNGYRGNISIYSINGDYIGKVDNQGRGPEEYTYISDFDIYPDSNLISILDPGRRIIYNYSIVNSKFQSLRKFDIWAKEFKYFKKNNAVFTVLSTHLSKSSKNGKDMDIYVINNKNIVIQSEFPFDKPQGMNFGNGITMMPFNNYINYLKPNTNYIYTINNDSIFIKYKIEFTNKVIPMEKTEEFFRNKLKSDIKYTYSIIYFENNRFVYTRFVSDKKSYHGFYNKSTKESYLFNSQKDLSCNCGVALRIIGNTPNKFILKSDIFKINSLIKTLDPNREKCTNPNIFKVIENMDETSNPLLILLELRS